MKSSMTSTALSRVLPLGRECHIFEELSHLTEYLLETPNEWLS